MTIDTKTKKQLNIIKTLSVLIGFSQALVIYIASSFFQDHSGREAIGVFYVATYVCFLFALFNLHKLVRKFGKTKVLIMTIMGELLAVTALVSVTGNWLAISAMVLYLLFDNLLLVNLDILLESFSSDGDSGRIRGIHLTIMNLGFIVGPKLSTWLLGHGGFMVIFASVFVVKLVALFFALRLGEVNHVSGSKETVAVLIKKALARADIRRIYYISYALESFYALMIIYSPIYMRSIGFDWSQIGIIFTIMLLPFLFFEYPVGWLADKKWGEKEMIIFALSWLSLATAWVYSLDRPVVWLWAVALLATRMAAAALQILRDSYFYKKVDGEDVDLIDFYRTAMPVAYVVAAGLSALVVEFYGVRQVFLLAAVIVISALIPAWRLVDNLSERDLHKSHK